MSLQFRGDVLPVDSGCPPCDVTSSVHAFKAWRFVYTLTTKRRDLISPDRYSLEDNMLRTNRTRGVIYSLCLVVTHIFLYEAGEFTEFIKSKIQIIQCKFESRLWGSIPTDSPWFICFPLCELNLLYVSFRELFSKDQMIAFKPKRRVEAVLQITMALKMWFSLFAVSSFLNVKANICIKPDKNGTRPPFNIITQVSTAALKSPVTD